MLVPADVELAVWTRNDADALPLLLNVTKDDGVKLDVPGAPEALSEIEPEKPFEPWRATVNVALPPCVTACELGLIWSEKSGVAPGVTDNDTLAVWEVPAPSPRIVMLLEPVELVELV